MKILFVVKKRESYYCDEPFHSDLSSGLLNSVILLSKAFKGIIENEVVKVVDAHDIDREVTKYKPTHVIIEALWVPPSKFDELLPLHPNVKWIVRNHSEIAFLSSEGIAMEWLTSYVRYPNVYIACNSPRAQADMRALLDAIPEILDDKVLYLPNAYPVKHNESVILVHNKHSIKIGCFGAIRPLKNQLIQAIAAVDSADRLGRRLEFHINGTRVEGGFTSQNILRNIRAIFDKLDPEYYKLIEHDWMPHYEFVKLCGEMDIVYQASFSETFNIVAADSITAGTEVIGTQEIPWLPSYYVVDANSSEAMVDKTIDIINSAKLFRKFRIGRARKELKRYTEYSILLWKSLEYLN